MPAQPSDGQPDTAGYERAWPVLEGLARAGFTEQLPRRLAHRFDLPQQAGEEAAAIALDVLTQRLAAGHAINNPEAYVLCTARNEGWRILRGRESVVAAVVDRHRLEQGEEERKGVDGAALDRALALVRRLIPRMTWEKPRLAMELMFEALEAGHTENLRAADVGAALGVSRRYAEEILSRGYRQLRRLAEDEGLSLGVLLDRANLPAGPDDDPEEPTDEE